MNRVTVLTVIALLMLLGPSARAQEAGAIPQVSQSAGGGTSDRDIDLQLAVIEREAKLSQTLGYSSPGFFAAIDRLRDLLPRSARTRQMQAQGIALRNPWPSGMGSDRPDPALTEIDQQVRRDPIYQRALLHVDSRLFPSEAVPKALYARQFPYGELQAGDVMLWEDRSGGLLSRIGDFAYARTFTHAALYLGAYGIDGAPRGVRRTYEAQNPARGVVSDRFDGRWDRHGIHVALGHVKNFSLLRALVVASQAHSLFGDGGQTPYHIWPPWNKEFLGDGLYCSQMVWYAYARTGVDLDSNDWHYIAWFAVHNWWEPLSAQVAYYGVFPDELRASQEIDWYYDQVNP